MPSDASPQQQQIHPQKQQQPQHQHRSQPKRKSPRSPRDNAGNATTAGSEDKDHVRLQHSSDLLRQMALKSSIRRGGKKLKVITYREWTSDGHPFSRKKLQHNPAVILAKPGKEAGRRVVDYYYSLKGKTGTRPLKGANRQSQFLEGEFAKLIDEAYQEHSNDSKATSSKKEDTKSASTNRFSAQSLPFGIENKLAKLRIMNPDPSRTSRSSGTSSHSRKSSPLAAGSGGSPWSSSEALHHSGHKHTHRRHNSHSSSAASETSSSSSSSSTEALVILLDDDDDAATEDDSSVLTRSTTWHGLESRLSRSRPSSFIEEEEWIEEEECSSDDECSDCEECCEPDSGKPAVRPMLTQMVHHSYPPPPPPMAHSQTIHSTPNISPVAHSPMIHTPVLHTPMVHSPPIAAIQPPMMHSVSSPPGFMPSPLPFAAAPSLASPPPGFIPLTPALSMKDVVEQGRLDLHGQQKLDNYAASSPYAFRPSLYFSPHSTGTIALPATPLSIHQYLGTPQRAASL